MIIRCDSGPTDWLPVESVATGGTYKIFQLNSQQALYVLDVRIQRQLGEQSTRQNTAHLPPFGRAYFKALATSRNPKIAEER
jgi:hypothetical protein